MLINTLFNYITEMLHEDFSVQSASGEFQMFARQEKISSSVNLPLTKIELEEFHQIVNSFATRSAICPSARAPACPTELLMTLTRQMCLSCTAPNSAHSIAITRRNGATKIAIIRQ